MQLVDAEVIAERYSFHLDAWSPRIRPNNVQQINRQCVCTETVSLMIWLTVNAEGTTWIFTLLFFKIVYCVHVCGHQLYLSLPICGEQTHWCWFFRSTIWVLGIKLGLLAGGNLYPLSHLTDQPGYFLRGNLRCWICAWACQLGLIWLYVLDCSLLYL